MTELLLEGLVDSLHERELLARTIGDTRAVLVARVSFADDVLHDCISRGVWRLESIAVSDLQLFACFCFDSLQLFFGEALVAQEHTAELRQWVCCLSALQLFFAAVERVLIRVGVCADTYAVCRDDDRRAVLDSVLTCSLHGVHGVEDVLTIAEEDLEMADTSIVLPDAWVSRLLVRRHGDTIAIALQDEDDWEALTCCTIDSFEDVAFGS